MRDLTYLTEWFKIICPPSSSQGIVLGVEMSLRLGKMKVFLWTGTNLKLKHKCDGRIKKQWKSDSLGAIDSGYLDKGTKNENL